MPREKWTVITRADIESRMSGEEFDVFTQRATTPGGTKPNQIIQAVIDQVTEKVRGAVSACPKNRLGPVGTIPSCLLYDAVSLAMLSIMTRVGGSALDASGRRKDDADRARTMIDEKLPRCEGPAIPQPDEEDGSMVQQVVEPAYKKWHTEEWRRDQQDGI